MPRQKQNRAAQRPQYMGAFIEALDAIDPALADDSTEWGSHAINSFNKGIDPKTAAAKYAKARAKRKGQTS